MNIVFMGTPEFSVAALDALVATGHRVLAAYTQPPRPAGRGQKEQPSPVQRAAERHRIPVRVPRSLRDAAAQAEFKALGADLAVVAAYGLILPKAILDAPLRGCLNIHASLLPRWRGAAPIQRAIEAGDTETGVCLMKMEKGLDTGPVLLREEYRVALLIGVLGGYTTFSSFGRETMALIDDGQFARASVNVVLSNGVGLFAVWLGARLAERWFGA